MRVISIEGIDGTGKTSLLKGLEDEIKSNLICFDSFPSEWFRREYEKLKGTLEGKEFHKRVNDLHTEDKLRTYKYWKEQGKEVMICDRFELTQKVYDGEMLGQNTLDTGITSELVIFLDADVDVVLSRIETREQEDYLDFENKEMLTVMRERYESIIHMEYKDKVRRIHVLKETTKEQVKEDALSILTDENIIKELRV